MKTKRKTNKNLYISLLILMILILVFIVLFGMKSYFSLKATDESTNTNKTSNDVYYLRSNATDYQIKLHKELEELLSADEKDEPAIASSIVQNYVADYYTWTNKKGSYDVGGMYFVNSSQLLGIYRSSIDYFYKYLSYYIDKYGAENLLEVENVEISSLTYAGTYTLNEVGYDSWYMWAKWKYKESDIFNEEDFATFEIFVVANIDGKYEIVEAYVE